MTDLAHELKVPKVLFYLHHPAHPLTQAIKPVAPVIT